MECLLLPQTLTSHCVSWRVCADDVCELAYKLTQEGNS